MLLKIEYLAIFVLGMVLFSETGYSWWWFVGLFFVPDISMLGYLINSRVGAFAYNLFHHFAMALLLLLCGKYFHLVECEMIGALFLAHAAFDRMLGYGLKYSDSFFHTHLGNIKKP